jgi:DeoR family glycerol-3-phosphate regulon repressor/DeoR family fructose operon transcriptional repressor
MAKSVDSILPARRRVAIAATVGDFGQATVSDLATRFEVSVDTIRRDIDSLAAEGAVIRTRGGAMAAPSREVLGRPLGRRFNENLGAKNAIAMQAAQLIADGETVIFNGGTTTLAVATMLTSVHKLTVVTNNVLIPQALPESAAQDVLLVGGNVRTTTMTTLGPLSFPAPPGQPSHAVSADIAVIGVGGITADNGISVSNLTEAQMIREMVAASSRVIIVADSSKIGVNDLAQISPLAAVNVLVSDINADHPVARALARTGGTLVSVH